MLDRLASRPSVTLALREPVERAVHQFGGVRVGLLEREATFDWAADR